ncbi:hypothetical protein [Amycolatopsis sp. NPDC003731]
MAGHTAREQRVDRACHDRGVFVEPSVGHDRLDGPVVRPAGHRPVGAGFPEGGVAGRDDGLAAPVVHSEEVVAEVATCGQFVQVPRVSTGEAHHGLIGVSERRDTHACRVVQGEHERVQDRPEILVLVHHQPRVPGGE